MLGAVGKTVQGALPGLHGHVEKALIHATFAMLVAGHCQLSRLALVGPARATAPSRERRWQRLVANEHLGGQGDLNRWARWVLADVGEVTLILDETPQGNRLRAMKLSRQIRGRAVPLLWHCYQPHALPMSQDRLVLDLLERAARALPEGAQVTLLADRGLAWPAVLDSCTAHGWHYLLRIQGQTRVRLPDGGELRADALTSRAGAHWYGAVQVFKKAGWRTCNLVARWQAGCDQPWLLITDLPANGQRCRQYRKRMRIEESFRDEKSHGFQWNQSRIRHPQHASRLLLVMALAMNLAIQLGLLLIKTGQRHRLERRRRPTHAEQLNQQRHPGKASGEALFDALVDLEGQSGLHGWPPWRSFTHRVHPTPTRTTRKPAPHAPLPETSLP
jgi:hypothetical protein